MPFTSAVCTGNLEIVQWLVKEGQTNENVQFHHTEVPTALADTAEFGRQTVQWLVREGGPYVNLEWQHDGDVLSAAAVAAGKKYLETLQ